MDHEQSRREFLASATIGAGGIIGFVLGVPLLGSLVPPLLADGRTEAGSWRPLPAHAFDEIAASAKPVELEFSFSYADAYLPPTDRSYTVWGIGMNAAQERAFRAKRPDLFAAASTPFEGTTATKTFAIFSGVCPHLGGRFAWVPELGHFRCPLHGSEFGTCGEKLRGPALRGLDPLPVREHQGVAQITWITYGSNRPDRAVVAYV